MTHGTIFLLGGINDVWVVGRAWRRFLTASGLPHAIELIRWQQGLWATLTFADLWRTSHHRATAAELAERIRQTHRTKLGEPIHVLAHSAGTAIAAYALEQLAPEEAITSAVFVASGLSPHYDLTVAVQRTKSGILCVESWLDVFFLGIGTTLLGSADRRWGPAAGMVGFRTSPEKLHATRWTPRYLRQGWLGGHISIAAPGFVRETLVPWIRQAEGSDTSGNGLRAKTQSATG
jgi:pimeloyl-ACP methyl ester carboxylesterase